MKRTDMTHASLFSGIGGFDLAAEWMGWQNVFNCEIDPFCRKILAYHFPNTKQYDDVKTTDFTIHRGHIDVLTGGFPCQPFSQAGKRKGSDDNRYLWPEMLRAIREIAPRWVVGENVFGIVNWSDGMVFEQVQSDLENEGYEVQSFFIPACAVDAPHRRNRVWFIAYRCKARVEILQREGAIGVCEFIASTDYRCDRGTQIYEDVKSKEPTRQKFNRIGSERNSPHPGGDRLEGSHQFGCKETRMREYLRRNFTRCNTSDFSKFPTQSPVCCGNDGLSNRLDSITFSAWRRESIKAYGNAVVPQIPYLLFKTIEQYTNLHEENIKRPN